MRRFIAIFILLLLILSACRVLAPAEPLNRTAPTRLLPTETVTPSPSPAENTRPPSDEPDVSLARNENEEQGFSVRYHPDGPLMVGDQVSLEVIAPPGVDPEEMSVEVRVKGARGEKFGPVDFGRYGIGGRAQATLLWVWDTSRYEPGEYTLGFKVEPGEVSWDEKVVLHAEEAVPPPEPEARWAKAESDCCLVYYITGTAAERDLDKLLDMLDEQARYASHRLRADFSEPVTVTFLPRVLGHGGFAGKEVSVSYLDRNYAGNATAIVLHHEMVHILDSHLGGELRPTLFVEGLAVYLSGGHFKAEPLMPRAAALLPAEPGCEEDNACGLGIYLPIAELADEFYKSQHEIGYLEASALIEYMVSTWGWEDFSDFYRDIHPDESREQAKAIDTAVQKHFGLSLDELEEQFIAALKDERLTPQLVEDTRLTVEFYDAVRRYQQVLDPSAYYLHAWLPDSEKTRERGIVADFLRHPSAPENLALETLLVAADSALREGDYARTDMLLGAVNAVLDDFPQQGKQAFKAVPLARDYLAIVQLVLQNGYEPQQIRIDGNAADIAASSVTSKNARLTRLYAIQDRGAWRLALEVSSLSRESPDAPRTARRLGGLELKDSQLSVHPV